MGLCVYCKTEETQLYVSGIPICLACADARETAVRQNRFVVENGNGHAIADSPDALRVLTKI
jgi:hypothetical protein